MVSFFFSIFSMPSGRSNELLFKLAPSLSLYCHWLISAADLALYSNTILQVNRRRMREILPSSGCMSSSS